jgi:hypothetical protein
MPLVIGASAVALIFLAILILFTIYWMLTRFNDFAKGIPAIGGALSNVATYLRDRNAEIIADVAQIAQNVINWGINSVHDGFKLLHDFFVADLTATVIHVGQSVLSVENYITAYVNVYIAQLQAATTDLQHTVNGFVTLNINALTFWRTQMIATMDHFVIPSINALITRVDYATGIQIPTIQARLGAAENTLQVTLPAEIAETKTDVSAVQRELARTTTAPGTGLLDRVKGVEGAIGQVLPWATAIGLSIPIARVLARVGRNPCTCLEEDGQTDMLPMLMYLMIEAG